ncbi:MAG: hypothetical protein K1X57_20070 [Gemmataceae bacterium]|nr:hypothetical protein [Gemmataceae bacterium]
MESDEHPRRAYQNAPGPFYAKAMGCDCGCLLPEAEAPELLATAGPPTFQTYFRRQPVTPAEVERACAAMLICPVHSLRYGGLDPLVLTQLARVDYLCDFRLAEDGSVVPR